MNRRLAPDVYREVAPIHLAPDGRHSFVARGPVVDYAVRMRRLPDAWSAAARLRRGSLDRANLDRLSARLARFYATADQAPQFGTIECLRVNVEENFAQVRPFVGDLVDAATIAEVSTFHEGWLRERAARFAARVAGRSVRDGHGDLRLDHVYFPARDASLAQPPALPDPIVIDCVEFNSRFRCGDVAGDLAFLAMELDEAGRPDLGVCLSSFAAHSQDFDLYGVVDFYLSYRAFVRAKVACFVAADPATAAEHRRSKRGEAERLFGLSRAYAGRALEPPALVAVAGDIGTGKSTLADELAWRLRAPVIGSDRTRKWLAGLAPTERGDALIYDEAFTRRTYQEVLRRARVVIESGRSAIAGRDLPRRATRDNAARAGRPGGCPLPAGRVALRRPGGGPRKTAVSRRTQPSVSDATDATLEG